MDGWRGDAETALDVGFGGRPEVDARVGVDEGETLALGRREAGFRVRQTIRFTCRFDCASEQEVAMNVGYRVTLTQYERDGTRNPSRAGAGRRRANVKPSADPAGGGRRRRRRGRSQPVSASAARRCTAPNGGSWRATWSGL